MNTKTNMRFTIEIQKNSCDFIPFNEIVVLHTHPEPAHLQFVDSISDDEVISVWPQCSGALNLIIDVSPSEL